MPDVLIAFVMPDGRSKIVSGMLCDGSDAIMAFDCYEEMRLALLSLGYEYCGESKAYLKWTEQYWRKEKKA